MDTISCIFCKTQKEDPVFIQDNGFTGRKCEHCGLVYISPRPSLQEIENLYAHDGAQIAAESHTSISFNKRLHARYYLTILRRYIQTGSLLEIGAGAGFFMDEARNIGFDVHGLEWNPKQVDFIRNVLNIPCEKGALQDAFDGKCFNVIYHCDVMSHFYDPISAFAFTNKRLKTGGILMFETGNGDFQEKYLTAFSSFQYPDHLFLFSEKNIRDLLALTGFELLSIHKWSILPHIIIKKISRKLLFPKVGSRDHDQSPQRSAVRESSETRTTDQSGRHSIKNISHLVIQWALDVLSFFLRYKIGYLFPKNKAPCTMIVVARKKENILIPVDSQ